MDISPAIPPQLLSVLGEEKPDFAVKSRRKYGPKKGSGLLVFGFIWTVFVLGIISLVFIPVLMGQTISMEINGMPTTASPGNLSALITPAIFLFLFLSVGLLMLSTGLYWLLAPGGWIAGTATRIVMVGKETRSIDWENFSGNIELKGDDHKGTITLDLRTGSMQSNRNGQDYYVPDQIFLVEIPGASAIADICRRRIKENDPTPGMTTRPGTSVSGAA